MVSPSRVFFFWFLILYLIFCFSYFDHLNDNDDDSDDSDEDHTNTAAAARDATRLEPLGKVIPYLTLFNYTNKYLKLICLWIEMSGAAGKEDGAGDKRGLKMQHVLSLR